MNTTSTAQYAAVAPKTSCLFALVNTETAVAKINANISVTEAINLADTLQVRKIYIGIRSNAVEATAIITLMKVPKRSAE
jgi:hypothetical protein